MEPEVWTEGAFATGRTLIETIEQIPSQYQGAVLLATPDVACILTRLSGFAGCEGIK